MKLAPSRKLTFSMLRPWSTLETHYLSLTSDCAEIFREWSPCWYLRTKFQTPKNILMVGRYRRIISLIGAVRSFHFHSAVLDRSISEWCQNEDKCRQSFIIHVVITMVSFAKPSTVYPYQLLCYPINTCCNLRLSFSMLRCLDLNA